MTDYEKEIYLEYLKTIPRDIPEPRRDTNGNYILPKPERVFNINGKGK